MKNLWGGQQNNFFKGFIAKSLTSIIILKIRYFFNDKNDVSYHLEYFSINNFSLFASKIFIETNKLHHFIKFIFFPIPLHLTV